MAYRPTIGLEIHVELKTKSKMFCSCLNDPEEKRPNTNICPICLGHPGTLPVINRDAVRRVLKAGLALGCNISEKSKFDRKNYFYPDLPKGYQISQYDMPFCEKGNLKIGDRKIRITRVHLEEDTGRLVHPEGADYSLVDFNRAGIPLMELVTEPDINSAAEARSFAQELQLILRYLDVSDADMEKGQMRVEANISIASASSESGKLGTKVEVKNLNSFRSVERAIDYEIKRQAKVLDGGKKIIQETRGWNAGKEITFSQREKEEAHDYRYFPEPDLIPLNFTEDDSKEIKQEISELPQAKRERMVGEYGLDNKETEFFVQNKGMGEYFEKVISEFESGISGKETSKLIKLAANYLISDLQGIMKTAGACEEELVISPKSFAEFISMIDKGEISSKIAKTLLAEMFKSGKAPSLLIKEKGLEQIGDSDIISSTASDVVAENPKAAEDFIKGKKEALQFLIGKMMAKTKGRIDPDEARKALEEKLS